MTDLFLAGKIQTPDEYTQARERLKRLRESADPETVADIVALQGEIAKYESALLVLGAPDDEHATHLGAGGAV